MQIKRYVQTHALNHESNSAIRTSPNAAETFDGVAELWWDSVEDLLASGQTEAGQRASAELLQDEAKFIDHPNSPLWISKQHVIIGNSRPW